MLELEIETDLFEARADRCDTLTEGISADDRLGLPRLEHYDVLVPERGACVGVPGLECALARVDRRLQAHG